MFVTPLLNVLTTHIRIHQWNGSLYSLNVNEKLSLKKSYRKNYRC